MHNMKPYVYKTEINRSYSKLFMNKENVFKPCYVMLDKVNIKIPSNDFKPIQSDAIAEDLNDDNISVGSNNLLKIDIKEKMRYNKDIGENSVTSVISNNSTHFETTSTHEISTSKPSRCALTKLNVCFKRPSEDLSDNCCTTKKFRGENREKESKCKSLYSKHDITGNERNISEKFSNSVIQEEMVKPCSVILSKLDRSILDAYTQQHSSSHLKRQHMTSSVQDYENIHENPQTAAFIDSDEEIENFYRSHTVCNKKKKNNSMVRQNCRNSLKKDYFHEFLKHSDMSPSSYMIKNKKKTSVNSHENSDCNSGKKITKSCIVLIDKLNFNISYNMKDSAFESYKVSKKEDFNSSDEDSSFISLNGTQSSFEWMNSSDSDVEDQMKMKELSLLYFANKFKKDMVNNEYSQTVNVDNWSEEQHNHCLDNDASSVYSSSTEILDDMSQLENSTEKEYCGTPDKNEFHCSSVTEQNMQNCALGLKTCFVKLERIDEQDFVSTRLKTECAENISVCSVLPKECNSDFKADFINLKLKNNDVAKCEFNNGNSSEELSCTKELSQSLSSSCNSCNTPNPNYLHHTKKQSELDNKDLTDSKKHHISVHAPQNKTISSDCDHSFIKSKTAFKTKNDFNDSNYHETFESEKFKSSYVEDTNDLSSDQDTIDYDAECIEDKDDDYMPAASGIVEAGDRKSCSIATCNSYQDEHNLCNDLEKNAENSITIGKSDTTSRLDHEDHKKMVHNAIFPATSVNSQILDCNTCDENLNSSTEYNFRSRCGEKYIVDYFEYENIKKVFITVKLNKDTGLLNDKTICDKSKHLHVEYEDLSNSDRRKKENAFNNQHTEIGSKSDTCQEQICDRSKHVHFKDENLSNSDNGMKKNLFNNKHVSRTEVENKCNTFQEQNSITSKSETLLQEIDTNNCNNLVKSLLTDKKLRKPSASSNSSSIKNKCAFVISDTSDDDGDSETFEHRDSGSGDADLSSSNESDFNCIQCMAEFFDKHEYFSHICQGKREKGFLCKYCEKIFNTSNKLKRHRKLHKN